MKKKHKGTLYRHIMIFFFLPSLIVLLLYTNQEKKEEKKIKGVVIFYIFNSGEATMAPWFGATYLSYAGGNVHPNGSYNKTGLYKIMYYV